MRIEESEILRSPITLNRLILHNNFLVDEITGEKYSISEGIPDLRPKHCEEYSLNSYKDTEEAFSE